MDVPEHLIRLTPEIARRLDAEARRQGVTASALVCASLDRSLPPELVTPEGEALPFEWLYEGEPSLAAVAEEALRSTWGPALAVDH
ncbi:MAG: hypothetical protein ACKVVT_19665 [Dehalococcoidia bacterium]